MDIVLEDLRKHGQRLDLEISSDTGLPIAEVHRSLEALVKAGSVTTLKLTRFQRGQRIEALQCRFAGYLPPLGRAGDDLRPSRPQAIA